MKRAWIMIVLSLCLLGGRAPGADLQLATLFADRMVLQRDMPAPVWGWADAGEAVTVEFGGQKKTATADAEGKWMVKLDPLTASAEERELRVSGAGEGRAVVVAGVLVGEVWLGSGQSNMAMGVSRSRDFEKEKAASDLPLIRMFKEESATAATPQAKGKGQWTVCSPETVGTYSATLFFFGRELHRALGVPVGLINSSVGGTPIEAWIDAGAQRARPELEPFFAAQTRANADFDPVAATAAHQKAMDEWKKKAAAAKAAGQAAPKAPRNPADVRARKADVGGLFNGKIAPLIPFAIRGAVWYQGEANGHPGKSQYYQYQLPLLVGDWRARWGQGDFPFAWVQLPNFGREGEHWMLVREGMLKSLSAPNTGMAIAIDIGDEKNIHPTNKQEVGRRLSLWALGTVYQQPVPATSGPLPAGHEIKGGEIVLSFTHADGGLKAREGEIKGFVVAGEDKQFKPAQARIEGDKVIVSSPEVPKPVAARYSWAPMPDGNLVNGADLPASPMRTDDWVAPEPETPAATPAPARGKKK